MNHYRIGPPPKWWPPSLSPWMVRRTSRLRRYATRKLHRVVKVHVHNEDVLRQALGSRQGVMITPNHSSHADPHSIYDAADLVGSPIFIMATWHVFDIRKRIGQWLLQKHGCFSVDRDGADRKAYREAIRILQSEPYPLVVFPEGEIYHCNDQITPFLEGPATMASTAARKSDREIVLIPCAMKYRYVDDPTEKLREVMTDLERGILWRPREHNSLKDRIYDYSEAVLALKEIEFTGRSGSGSLPDRVRDLSSEILARHELTRGIGADGKTIPERVKELRRRSVMELCSEDRLLSDVDRSRNFQQLDDAFLVGQLFSYPGNYVAESPTIERIAETIDKFEEDALQRPTASIRGRREVHVCFGEPLTIASDRKEQTSPAVVTRQLETAVQQMLDNQTT